jgi:hypothetical protein
MFGFSSFSSPSIPGGEEKIMTAMTSPSWARVRGPLRQLTATIRGLDIVERHGTRGGKAMIAISAAASSLSPHGWCARPER